ncbi:hypothetical protein CTRI78_v000039 [Colletotrichum trifolii]|uniref:Protein kinase domain-containing protein n=1 Tax=Colletotrichum trifolii TaxID=5466 RepID=A0A4R8RWB6_COLTR|nr:hypothetical protein CTRI78_v000039 [Colletotrichum trifolii]
MLVPNSRDLLDRISPSQMYGATLDDENSLLQLAAIDVIEAIFQEAWPSEVKLVPVRNPLHRYRAYMIEFDHEPMPGVPRHLLIEIKLEPAPRDGSIFVSRPFKGQGPSSFEYGARLQDLARSKIPDLVPRVISLGVLSTMCGPTDYIITTRDPDTVCLQEVWSSLEDENKVAIASALATGLQKLHELDLEAIKHYFDHASTGDIDHATFDILRGSLEAGTHVLEGDCDQGVDHVVRLLEKFDSDMRVPGHDQTSLIDFEPDGGISIMTILPDNDNPRGRPFYTEVCSSDLHELAKSMTICHMDLEPRNIFVKLVPSETSASISEYELASIVSWERAQVAPFSFERGVKDAVLGSQFNDNYNWYRAFVNATRSMVPNDQLHDGYILALVLMRMACRSASPDEPSSKYHKLWREKEKVIIAFTTVDGYVRDPEAHDHVSPTEEEYRQMADDILTEAMAQTQQYIDRLDVPRLLHSILNNELAGVMEYLGVVRDTNGDEDADMDGH